jgi:hypothetical protein
MAGKKPKPTARPSPAAVGGGSGTVFGVLLRSLLAVGIVAAVVAGVNWLGDHAGQKVADRDRYQTAVADIRCDAPPGSERAAFLSEVRHLGPLPAAVSAVDPQTPVTLAAAFARHPWVEKVDGVTVAPDRTVTAALTFRTPTLAVRVDRDPEPRVVDRHAVLIPASADGLPVLTPAMLPPVPKPGEKWAGEVVPRAAELADQHRSRRLLRVEKTAAGWRLVPTDGAALVVRF